MVSLRHKLLVDAEVQGSLLRRTAMYGTSCALYFMVILVFTESMSDPQATIGDALGGCLNESIYWLPGLAILAPIISYDLLKFTNRFTGPVARLRTEMRRLTEDKSDDRLCFREDDYWVEMADVFNDLRDEVIDLRKELAASKRAAQSPDSEPPPPLQSPLFAKKADDDQNGGRDGDQDAAEKFLATGEAVG